MAPTVRSRNTALKSANQPSQAGPCLLRCSFHRAENYYMRKIEAHRDEETRRGRPKNEALISRIDTIWRPARSRFTDEACLATHATASAKRVE
jgi:hypothetical protein